MAKCKDCIHYDVCPQDSIPTDMHPTYIDFSVRDDVEESCWDFKDKSKFIEIPCSVGDRVYVALKDWKYPLSFEIMDEPVIPVYHFMADTFIKISDFGKIVFQTYEEAKKKLEELNNAH